MSGHYLVWHYGYADVAIVQYERLRELASGPLVEFVGMGQPADYRFSEVTSAYLSVVVFSEMAIEAYINYYGISRLGSGFYTSHIDRLDLRSKWVIVPQLVTGKQFPKTGQGYGLLSRLVKNRNSMVHKKPVDIGTYPDLHLEELDPRQHLANATEAIQAMEMLHKDLLTVDPEAASLIRPANPGKFTELHELE